MVLIFFGILWFLDVVRILLNGIIANDFCEISIFYKKVAENYLTVSLTFFIFIKNPFRFYFTTIKQFLVTFLTFMQ